ncbi:hypothetical protein [Endozoicomonas sp.]|uniref:hypothetical protein n=1 Tax=Endozoicomonas sp. TaxID=1892382 RepID=UPI0028856805|nr:hypothetical protein [Endozoicomonas sp.]
MESLVGKSSLPSQKEVSFSATASQHRTEPDLDKNKPKYASGRRSVSIPTPPEEGIAGNISLISGESRPAESVTEAVVNRRVRSQFEPEVLVPGSKKLQNEESMSRDADALDYLHEEIIRMQKEGEQLYKDVAITCIGLRYNVNPPEAVPYFQKLEGLIREYERKLSESFPSIRARGISDDKLQGVLKKYQLETDFRQEVMDVKAFGCKKLLEGKYWHGMNISRALIGFKCKLMNANFAFSDIIHTQPALMRPDFAPVCYATWIVENLDLLRILYQVVYASEQLAKNNLEYSRFLYDRIFSCGSFIMKEVCDLLKFTCLNDMVVDFPGLLESSERVLIHWLDEIDLQQFDSLEFSKKNSRRLLYTIIGHCLLGDGNKACLYAQRMMTILPFGAVEKGDIFLLIYYLTFVSDVLFRDNATDLEKYRLRVSACENLIGILQRICEAANAVDKFGEKILPDEMHYHAVRLIHVMSLSIKSGIKKLEIEEEKRNDTIIALIGEEERGKKTDMEARLMRQRESVRGKRYNVKEIGEKAPVANVTEEVANENKEGFTLHSDICAAINLYLSRVPFHDVEKQLEALLADGGKIDVALAQYALADMLRDKVDKSIELSEGCLPTVEQFNDCIVKNKLPDIRLDFLFLEAMQVYTRESGVLCEDLNRLHSVVSKFNNSCSDEQGVLHDIADKMVELHDRLSELTKRGEEVAKHCQSLKSLYRRRGYLLKSLGKIASNKSDKARSLGDIYKTLNIRGEQIEEACSSLRLLASWEVCYRAQQILDEEAQGSSTTGMNRPEVGSVINTSSADKRNETIGQLEQAPIMTAGADIEGSGGECNPQNSNVDELNKHDLPIVSDHALPESFVKASCNSFKQKGCAGKLRAEDVSSSEPMDSVTGKSKKTRRKQRKKQAVQRASKAKALLETEVKPYELETRFNKYVKNHLEKGVIRSGKQVPEWFDVSRWLKRYDNRLLFSLDEFETWSSMVDGFDYSDLKCDLMVYAEALEWRIKVEFEYQVVSIFHPGMIAKDAQADVGFDQYDIELVRVKKEWFASHNHYWDNYA